ncbi:unnamed protein product [Calypogeia fissa]
MEKGVAPSRQKQLLFDRRYGWVYEEWTDPVEVANIGGRGMFSVVPLTAATIDGTLHLANLAADVLARTAQSHKLSRWPFQIQQTADGEKSTQMPSRGINRSVAPTSVQFRRRNEYECWLVSGSTFQSIESGDGWFHFMRILRNSFEDAM